MGSIGGEEEGEDGGGREEVGEEKVREEFRDRDRKGRQGE